MSDVSNDGGLPHSSFAATLSNGNTYDFERFVPDRPTKTLNQYDSRNAPKKSVDTRDFRTAQATIQVQTLEDQAKVAQATGNGSEADRLQSKADAIRAQRPELKSMERYPIQKTQEQIENISKQVDLIQSKLAKIPHIT